MMAEKDIILKSEEDTGLIKVSNEVVLIISSQALNDIEGAQIATTAAEGIVDMLVKKPAQRGVKIYLSEDEKFIDIDIHININYGVNIHEISWKIQEAVKKNVETMTDISVSKVNVFVDGVILEKEPKAPKVKRSAKSNETRSASKEEQK